jgi:hypothetical protein
MSCFIETRSLDEIVKIKLFCFSRIAIS